jgi:hypothetical protein
MEDNVSLRMCHAYLALHCSLVVAVDKAVVEDAQALVAPETNQLFGVLELVAHRQQQALAMRTNGI